QTRERLGRADVADDLFRVAGAHRVVSERPVGVLANIKVRVAVAVEIRPGRAGAPQRLRQSRLSSHVDETPASLAVGLVAIEDHAAPAGNQEVRPTIAVIISDGTTVRIEHRLIEPGLLRHVPESPAAQVLIEPVAIPLYFLPVGTVEIASAGDEDVEQAV